MSIYIFSRAVHSGKTTELRQWCDQQTNIGGILMPDINGSRKIFDIAGCDIFDIECTDPSNTKEPFMTVGRFHFYTSAFEKANLIVMNALTQKYGWLVIDEAGKLELEGKGFYSSIVKAVAVYKHDKKNGNLLITVRESLCDEIIAFFNLADCRVIKSLNDLA